MSPCGGVSPRSRPGRSRPQVALAAWRWLAVRGAPEASEKALALAQALFEHESVIALLEAKARRHDLKLTEVLSLVDALESEGNPERARAGSGDSRPLFTNDPEYWKERASVDEHIGDLDGALISLREVDRRFAGFVEVGQEPELLWSMDRPDEALALARQQAQTAAPVGGAVLEALRRSRLVDGGRRRRGDRYQHVWAAGAETPRLPSGSQRCSPRPGAPTISRASRRRGSRSSARRPVLLTGWTRRSRRSAGTRRDARQHRRAPTRGAGRRAELLVRRSAASPRTTESRPRPSPRSRRRWRWRR